MAKEIIITERGVERTVPMEGELLPPVRQVYSPTELNTASHTIQVQPGVTHEIQMRTSAVDRAQGFLISNVPLFAAFGFGSLLVCVFFYSVPFWSLTALVVFWLTFVGAWLISYIVTLVLSAEGIAFYEAHQRWGVIKREQEERWNYYRNIGGK